MKKTDFLTVPDCAVCDMQATELHEIMGGKTGKKGNSKRDICIEYDLQLPLCRKCHNEIGNTLGGFERSCNILHISPFSTFRAIENNTEIELITLQKHVHRAFWSRYEIKESKRIV